MAVYKPSVHLGQGHAAAPGGGGRGIWTTPGVGRDKLPGWIFYPLELCWNKAALDATCCVCAEHKVTGEEVHTTSVTMSQHRAHARASWTFRKFCCEGKPSDGERMPPHSRRLLSALQPDHSAAPRHYVSMRSKPSPAKPLRLRAGPHHSYLGMLIVEYD